MTMSQLPHLARFRWAEPGVVDGRPSSNPVKIYLGGRHPGDPSRETYRIDGEPEGSNYNVYGDPEVIPE